MDTRNPGLVAVQAGDGTTCGAITWWALSGVVDMEDLMDAFDAEGLDRAFLPPLPEAATALGRAAAECADKRTLVRPLDRRGMWEIVTESVVEDEHQAPRLTHSFECRVELRPDKTALVVPEDHRFAKKILAAYGVFRGSLTSTDLSYWLSGMVNRVASAVALRERGGMYFVPKAHMETWRRVARTLRACSAHVVYEVPALKTDEAVEAILTAVRHDAELELKAMEEYMARPAEKISTRGLNAYARQCAEVRAKLEHYAALLGVALPDMAERAENLAGAINAAKLIERSTNQGGGAAG